MKKTKRKLRIDRIIFLIIILLLIVLGMVKLLNKNDKIENNDGSIKNEENNNILTSITSNYKAIITSSSEQNKEIVEDYFANGMSAIDYQNTIEKIDNYLDISGKYQKLTFDFSKKYHYSELEEIYKSLALSNIVKIEIIGKSVDNRNLYSIEIGVPVSSCTIAIPCSPSTFKRIIS